MGVRSLESRVVIVGTRLKMQARDQVVETLTYNKLEGEVLVAVVVEVVLVAVVVVVAEAYPAGNVVDHILGTSVPSGRLNSKRMILLVMYRIVTVVLILCAWWPLMKM